MIKKSHHRWPIAPKDLRLLAGDVHVWKANLNVSTSDNTYLQSLLSLEELARAGRFYFEKDRQHWTVAHGILRLLLSHYLQIDPHQLRFEQNAYGKPALAFPSQLPQLQFNLSHSGNLALYAFTWKHAIGVDIEQIRADIEFEQLAHYNFSPYEYEVLSTLPISLRQQAFFTCWTRKEAYIKAYGMGLSLPLQQFDVSLTPNAPAALLANREDPGEVERWIFKELEPDPGYAGTLVIEGKDHDLFCWQYQQHAFLHADRVCQN